ncbi:HD domain-containing protein [Metallosphaera tengchongensis]|uniref:HD domain-containing protein n=1 Tax=Metallosphaera tengchongensis TaxID=1532350 RepID=A0A6N0NXA2_9CREN|nr:HD domain-containing protein [Metallosphaera tengchongensis]QKR00835.1 HD domain-containing protein [Metallosphaera tengchongensis]
MSVGKHIRDPIYGYVKVEASDLNLVDSPLFQRLRYIRQNGLAYLVFPSATHSRFEHSLGAHHVAKLMLEKLRKNGFVNDDQLNEISRLALVHDIGHLPFSHTFEHSLKFLQYIDERMYRDFIGNQVNAKFHELIGVNVLRNCVGEEGLAKLMEEIYVKKEASKQLVKAVISSTLDADRLDYLQRDSYYFGVKYGEISLDRIIEVMEIDRNGNYVFRTKGRDDLEHLLMARYHMYSAVYNHPVKGIFDTALAYTLANMIEDQTIPVEGVKDCEKFFNLTDDYVLSKLREKKDQDGIYKNFYDILLKRKKYKKFILEDTHADTFASTMENKEEEEKLYNFIITLKGNLLVYIADVDMPIDKVKLSIGNGEINLSNTNASKYVNVPSLRRRIIIGYTKDDYFNDFEKKFLKK